MYIYIWTWFFFIFSRLYKNGWQFKGWFESLTYRYSRLMRNKIEMLDWGSLERGLDSYAHEFRHHVIDVGNVFRVFEERSDVLGVIIFEYIGYVSKWGLDWRRSKCAGERQWGPTALDTSLNCWAEQMRPRVTLLQTFPPKGSCIISGLRNIV